MSPFLSIHPFRTAETVDLNAPVKMSFFKKMTKEFDSLMKSDEEKKKEEAEKAAKNNAPSGDASRGKPFSRSTTSCHRAVPSWWFCKL